MGPITVLVEYFMTTLAKDSNTERFRVSDLRISRELGTVKKDVALHNYGQSTDREEQPLLKSEVNTLTELSRPKRLGV